MTNEQRYRKVLEHAKDHAEDFALGYMTAVDRKAWVEKFIAPIRAALSATPQPEGELDDEIEDDIERGHIFHEGKMNERARIVALVKDKIGQVDKNTTFASLARDSKVRMLWELVDSIEGEKEEPK